MKEYDNVQQAHARLLKSFLEETGFKIDDIEIKSLKKYGCEVDAYDMDVKIKADDYKIRISPYSEKLNIRFTRVREFEGKLVYVETKVQNEHGDNLRVTTKK